MSSSHHDEFEPVWGLPEELPEGEKILWQGQPEFWSLARRAFHLVGLTMYFIALLAWLALSSQESVLSSTTLAGSLALTALALFATLAWFTCRTTVYTITTRRVVMRIGIALQINLNLPFTQIQSAQLKPFRDGTGDIPLDLSGDERVAYLLLWPHARPWRVRQPQPMLRSVPQADQIAELLAQALRDSLDQNAERSLADYSPQSAASSDQNNGQLLATNR